MLDILYWYAIPDCKKYKDLLRSPDKETVKLAIELLKADNIDPKQIRICQEKFLGIPRYAYSQHISNYEWINNTNLSVVL